MLIVKESFYFKTSLLESWNLNKDTNDVQRYINKLKEDIGLSQGSKKLITTEDPDIRIMFYKI